MPFSHSNKASSKPWAYQHVPVGKYSDGSNMVVNRGTLALLHQAEAKLGYSLTVVQGSYHKGTSQSAGTHDGGGAVDLAPYDWENKVKVLRDLGVCAWHRTPIPGVWGEHIHFVVPCDQELSPQAAAQVPEYNAGLDGLADNAPDPDPYRPNPPVVFSYADAHKAINRAKRASAAVRLAIKQLIRARLNTDDPKAKDRISAEIAKLRALND